jgi:hypothetical protein
MIDDPIVEEIRTYRQAHAARYDFDLVEIFATILEREKSSMRPVVNRPPRRISENQTSNISSEIVQPQITSPI